MKILVECERRYTMIKKVSTILWFVLISGLASCNMPVRINSNQTGGAVEQQYQAVSALLTQTANAVVSISTFTPTTPPLATPVTRPTRLFAAEITGSPDPTRPLKATVEGTPTFVPSFTQGVLSRDSQTVATPCDLAQSGRPLDVSVPDDTRFHPGQYFSKTWRLVNAGNCPWTRDYAVIWFSGNELGLVRMQPFVREVQMGQSVDITVDMVAPETPGTFQSNWKLRNQQGGLFGIGPKGNAPFWVRIVVVPVDTPTPTPQTPTATQPVIVYASGSLSLLVSEGVDLDSAQKNQSVEDDVALQNPAEGQLELAPMNSTRMVLYGISAPQLTDCQQAAIIDSPIPLEQAQVGAYICYRTTEDLPGRILIQAVDSDTGQVDLNFVTWAVP
jgi:hypothetical protein